jgi:hypothetical protein
MTLTRPFKFEIRSPPIGFGEENGVDRLTVNILKGEAKCCREAMALRRTEWPTTLFDFNNWKTGTFAKSWLFEPLDVKVNAKSWSLFVIALNAITPKTIVCNSDDCFGCSIFKPKTFNVDGSDEAEIVRVDLESRWDRVGNGGGNWGSRSRIPGAREQSIGDSGSI